MQKKYFKDFLTRLEERDKKLEQIDREVSSAMCSLEDPSSIIPLLCRLHQRML